MPIFQKEDQIINMNAYSSSSSIWHLSVVSCILTQLGAGVSWLSLQVIATPLAVVLKDAISQVLPITSPYIIFWENIIFNSFNSMPKAKNEAVDLHNSNMSDILDSIAQFKTGI